MSQCFENRQAGSCFDVSAEAGDYFQRPVLGRGLARVDWNTDGRDDFVVSHMGSPAALVQNESDMDHAFALKLVGTTSPREPIGAIVTLFSPSGQTQQQLTAGDGYHCRNEPQLLFVVPDATDTEVQVRWPLGGVERHRIPTKARKLLIIEDQGLSYIGS